MSETAPALDTEDVSRLLHVTDDVLVALMVLDAELQEFLRDCISQVIADVVKYAVALSTNKLADLLNEQPSISILGAYVLGRETGVFSVRFEAIDANPRSVCQLALACLNGRLVVLEFELAEEAAEGEMRSAYLH